MNSAQSEAFLLNIFSKKTYKANTSATLSAAS
jgi:hypothetical protein